MHAADELVLHVTQGCIAMVSLPVLVAVLQEAACLLKKNKKHSSLGFLLHSLADSLFEALSKAANPHNKDSERIKGD